VIVQADVGSPFQNPLRWPVRGPSQVTATVTRGDRNLAPWHARRRATDGATVACGHAVPRVVTNFTVHCSAARASHRRTARLMSRENPRPQKRAKLSLQLRERDTRGLFVLGTTLHCAHGGCVPCCYKIFQHAGPSSTRLRPNERPELCHRLRAGLPTGQVHAGAVCTTGVCIS
jgi:hypothetical protein